MMEHGIFIGLDIGGANIKAASQTGWTFACNFPLWKEKDRLISKLEELHHEMPDYDGVAMTMTGELADCFETKTEGVHFIAKAAANVFAADKLKIYLTSGKLVEVATSLDRPQEVAAANWHALANFVTRFANNQDALLIDIGSTTTDIIPLKQGKLVNQGMTDPQRLNSGELVYTGLLRTPLCSLMSEVILQSKVYSIAAEFFATTADVYLLLDEIPENKNNCDTADGRPLTKKICLDAFGTYDLCRCIRACTCACD